ESLSLHLNELKKFCDLMLEERKKANKLEDAEQKAFAYCDNVKPYFQEIKYHSDKLELLIEDELWPLPKLRELLFTK
ncbi:MAG: glutamine synthetase type III, partial [Flavobacteriales bacterium]|nr:glutamine synthetase type III [Flavobacteriales bacterium]